MVGFGDWRQFVAAGEYRHRRPGRNRKRIQSERREQAERGAAERAAGCQHPATRRDIFAAPSDDYTKALLAAIPGRRQAI